MAKKKNDKTSELARLIDRCATSVAGIRRLPARFRQLERARIRRMANGDAR